MEQRIDSEVEGHKGDGYSSLNGNSFDLDVADRVAEVFPGNEVLVEESELTGGGMGKGRKYGGGNGGGRGGGDESEGFPDGNADQNKIGAYYQQMLLANPGNPLLLRNYGKFLHEVDLSLSLSQISRFQMD